MELSPENDRKFGCILGAFVGDALGAYLESTKGKIEEEKVQAAMSMTGGWYGQLCPGQLTDDSEMAMCLLRGLVEGNGQMDLNPICKYYGLWIHSNPIGSGRTTKACLQCIDPNNPDPRKPYEKTKKGFPATSLSNGSMMRVTPLAVWCTKLSATEIEKAVTADA